MFASSECGSALSIEVSFESGTCEDAIYARPLEACSMGGENAVLVKRAFQIASWDRSIISQIDVAEQSHFRLTK